MTGPDGAGAAPAPVALTVLPLRGIGEVGAGADLVGLLAAAAGVPQVGGLRDGDVLVVTSKVVAKAEGRTAPAADAEAVVAADTVRTLASFGATRVVRTRSGPTLAAAGVDRSNVAPDTVVRLPADPDASARALRAALRDRTGRRLAVVISDTAGRPWRLGQTDIAVGAAGLPALLDYAGRTDGYGNPLRVTATAVADEVSAAADLVKGKLAGCPAAVVRGLHALVGSGPGPGAQALLRPLAEDAFAYGARESVLRAVLAATGQAERYEDLVQLPAAEGNRAALAGCPSNERAVLARVLAAAGGGPDAGPD